MLGASGGRPHPEILSGDSVLLCLAGDVMLGRGIDQIQRHPGNPAIQERWARSSLQYVELAEERSGPLPRGVDPGYVWGTALEVLTDTAPDAFIVNLETAVADRGHAWPGKAIQYRMHPANIGVLTAAGVHAATLANNHVLDWSFPGLEQTLATLDDAGIAAVGAGRDAKEAWEPAVLPTHSGGRVVVLGVGVPSSGIPSTWVAAGDRPGVAVLGDLTDVSVDVIARAFEGVAQPGDVVVVSVHWGGNWGYEIPDLHRRFAHDLIERAGVHVVHGHSSHHPLGIEIHQGRPILYGCGDLITDYEGIRGHEQFRGDLGALYPVTLTPGAATPATLELVPTRMRRFRLEQPPADDVQWLAEVLDRESATLGSRVSRHGERLQVE